MKKSAWRGDIFEFPEDGESLSTSASTDDILPDQDYEVIEDEVDTGWPSQIQKSDSTSPFSDQELKFEGEIKEPDWNLLLSRLLHFKTLPINWAEEGSIGPSQEALYAAFEVLEEYRGVISRYFLQAAAIHVVPLQEGGFSFEFVCGDLSLEIDIKNEFALQAPFKIHYLLTDDSELEEEKVTSSLKLTSLFYRLHKLI